MANQQDEVPDVDAHEAFHEAARAGDLTELARLLANGTSVDIPEPDADGGRTPLLATAQRFSRRWDRATCLKVIRFLLDHGANINAVEVDRDDRTVLLVAAGAEEGPDQGEDDEPTECDCGAHVGEVLDALAPGGRSEHRSDCSRSTTADTPNHKLELLMMLIERGADLTATDRRGNDAIHCAIISNSPVETCSFLLSSNRAFLRSKNMFGETPLHMAADLCQPEIVQLLLERGAGPNEPIEEMPDGGHRNRTRIGLTPLLIACEVADKEEACRSVVEHLIKAGVDVNQEGPEAQTALKLAAMHGYVSVIEVLRGAGATDEAGAAGAHPLLVAATKGHAPLCRYLVCNDGADVNVRDEEGYTPLIQASGYGNGETVRQLASLGADLEAHIFDGRRAIHFAAFKGKQDCMQVLLELGADVEAVDDSQWTALHFAARYHHPDVLRALLDHGASVDKKVVDGPTWRRADGQEEEVSDYTAADLARTRRGGAECVDMLLEHGDRLSDETKDLVDDDLLEEQSACILM